VDQPQIDPGWLRLVLVFLLGLLVGTLIIAATRQSSESSVGTTGNPLWDQVVADSEHIADLAGRAAAAARLQDATSLTNLVRELKDAQNSLANDVAGCHR
jgi:GAF domain-containing protein